MTKMVKNGQFSSMGKLEKSGKIPLRLHFRNNAGVRYFELVVEERLAKFVDKFNRYRLYCPFLVFPRLSRLSVVGKGHFCWTPASSLILHTVRPAWYCTNFPTQYLPPIPDPHSTINNHHPSSFIYLLSNKKPSTKHHHNQEQNLAGSTT